MKNHPDLAVLSGGSETTAFAVVEAALAAGMQPAVLATSPCSLLKGLPGIHSFTALEGDTRERVLKSLLAALSALRCSSPLAILPTEDDGLWLLNELRTRLPAYIRFSRAERLVLGGLDKAELFEALVNAGLEGYAAPTMTLLTPENYFAACTRLGSDCIVKPAFKPWRGMVGRHGIKVVTREHAGESDREVMRRLTALWPLCPRWVAQGRLRPLEGSERSVCIVRGSGEVRGCEVRERLKYPLMGGTAVWVESVPQQILTAVAHRIAEAVGLIGICELSFLADASGAPRLIELNTRPWLQVQLVEESGFPIVAHTVRALRGEPLGAADRPTTPHQWLQPERWLIAAWRGDRALAFKAIRAFLASPRHMRVWSIWSSRIPGAKRRWVVKLIRTGLLRITPGRMRRPA